MADISINANPRNVPPPTRGIRPVGDKGQQQDVKSAVHRELINRVDLEKLGVMQDSRGSQQQLLAVIHQLIAEQQIPDFVHADSFRGGKDGVAASVGGHLGSTER